MLTAAPASVILIGIFGMLVIAFAVARMTMLERHVPRPVLREPTSRAFADSGI